MVIDKKRLFLVSISIGFILALLTAYYLGSFGLDWNTFFVDLFASWITWTLILPFILRATNIS